MPAIPSKKKKAIGQKQVWRQRLTQLWPAAKGSLAKVYKRCIRKGCPACARGDKHPAWILLVSSGGRRRGMYVPLAMVSTLRQAIQNGRRIERMLARTGPELIQAYRKARKGTSTDPPNS